MSSAWKSEVVSVHKFRRTARRIERELQAWMASGRIGLAPDGLSVPGWARGARVSKAGRFCWAVIATEQRGH